MNEQPKKSIFKKWYFWVGLILLLGIVFVGLTAYSGIQSDKRRAELTKKGVYVQDIGKEYNSRIAKHFTPPSGTAFKYGSPMLYNEHIYIGTGERTGYDNAPIAKIHDNFFYKLDLDLNVKWQYPLGKKMVAGGAVMDSEHNLYFLTNALDDRNSANKHDKIFCTLYFTSLTEDGKLRFEKKISLDGDLWDHNVLTPAISKDDVIYFGDNHFYAYDKQGNKLAQYPTESDKQIYNYGGAPVIDSSGNVYFTSPEPVGTTLDTASDKMDTKDKGAPSTNTIKAYKFSPKLASLTWSTEMGNEILDNEGGNSGAGGGQKAYIIESPAALGVGGKSLYGIVGNTISKIDTATGELLWSLKPEGATGHINASPAIDGEDNLYVGTKSNTESRFYGISASGKQLWRTEVGSDLYNSPILGDDGLIYVGSEGHKDGKFHALNKKTGKQEWGVFNDSERSVPDFSHDSMLLYKGYAYVGVHLAYDENSGAICFPSFYKIRIDANDYLPGAAWPRIHGGNSNSGRIE